METNSRQLSTAELSKTTATNGGIGIIEEDPDEDYGGGRTTSNSSFRQKKISAKKTRIGFENQ